jgi:glycosyltransferase involved in cell wall biosynthesis
LFKDIRSILIFCSAKLSFVEKGFMVLIASLFKKNIVFAPRSGLTLIDYNESKFMRWFIRIVIRKSSYVLCQGTNWKLFYSNISKSKEEKFVVIHNWIDPTPYLQISSKKSNSIKKINLIYIGWLEDYKGIKDLLRALKMLASQNLNFQCKIHGNGKQYASSEKFIKSNNLKDFISLEGWANQEAKLNAFRNADIFILPSHYEGFPNALIEAMAAGLPVIVSDILAVSDIIINEYNGITFEPRNPTSLALNIERLLRDQDLRIKIGANARATVIENFTINIAVKKLEKIL